MIRCAYIWCDYDNIFHIVYNFMTQFHIISKICFRVFSTIECTISIWVFSSRVCSTQITVGNFKQYHFIMPLIWFAMIFRHHCTIRLLVRSLTLDIRTILSPVSWKHCFEVQKHVKIQHSAFDVAQFFFFTPSVDGKAKMCFYSNW